MAEQAREAFREEVDDALGGWSAPRGGYISDPEPVTLDDLWVRALACAQSRGDDLGAVVRAALEEYVAAQ